MFVSYRWLGRHVDLAGITPQQLADDLTLTTAEVEGLERFAPHLDDVLVGHVLERASHPDADKLGVCHVDLGDGESHQIVCGAPNVAGGQRVAVARVGTVLPGKSKLKNAKIRGVESRGMICSERELDLGDDHDGIWVLPNDLPIGVPVGEALGLEDWVIEIDNKSLTHRPDLWGHRGLAGEVAAIYRRELLPLDVSLPTLGDGAPFPVRIEDAACARFVGLAIDGALQERSPDWLRFLLLAVGQRPLDVLVDLSNFVMLDLGQPNHAFDRGRLSSSGIIVRKAREAERLTTLDGEERRLQPSDLLICSGEEPVALAGIMGGEGSKVDADTRTLLLEVATFHPGTIRRTASRLGLRTDASTRFEKHLDPTLPLVAAGHFARTLRQIQPGVQFPCQLSDEGDWTDPSHTLRLRTARVQVALGELLEPAVIEDILGRLGFGVTAAPDGFDVGVPAARATKDITIEADLIEEVGRVHRYGNIPERRLLAPVAPAPRDARRQLVRRVQDRLAGAARFNEVLSYSFQRDSLLAAVGLDGEPHVRVINPMAPDESRIRREVLPSLLERLVANRRHRSSVRLFEVGKGYHPRAEEPDAEPAEVHQVALCCALPAAGPGARFDSSALAQLQGVVQDLLAHLDLHEVEACGPATSPGWAHPNRAVELSCAGRRLALVADLEPGVVRALGLTGELASDAAAAVLSIDELLAAPAERAAYRPIPRFPGVKVDVAVVSSDQLPAAKIGAAIAEAGKGVVADVELFDVYRGDNIGRGNRSLAYHVLLQSPGKTLSDGDGQKFLTRLERLLSELGAQLRK